MHIPAARRHSVMPPASEASKLTMSTAPAVIASILSIFMNGCSEEGWHRDPIIRRSGGATYRFRRGRIPLRAPCPVAGLLGGSRWL